MLQDFPYFTKGNESLYNLIFVKLYREKTIAPFYFPDHCIQNIRGKGNLFMFLAAVSKFTPFNSKTNIRKIVKRCHKPLGITLLNTLVLLLRQIFCAFGVLFLLSYLSKSGKIVSSPDFPRIFMTFMPLRLLYPKKYFITC